MIESCFKIFLGVVPRTSGGNGSDVLLSPVRDKPDKEFANIQLKDLEIVATLGMGGFGRVELVSQRLSGKGFYNG